MIWLRLLLAGGIAAPVLAGLALTLAMALHPEAAGYRVAGWQTALCLTLVTGVGATVLSVALSVPLSLWLLPKARARVWLAPFLAVPHATLALGLVFLIAPSGWLVRLVWPFALPPAIVTVGDPWGVALILGLVLKEVPFLTLVTLAAAAQHPLEAHFAAGQSLGYSRRQIWRQVVWPMLYPALRLPVFITLAFSLSVVDMALLLGPSHPPTLAVQILRLFTAADPDARFAGARLAAGLLLVTGAVAGLWWAAGAALAPLSLHRLRRGLRQARGPSGGALIGVSGLMLGGAALLVLALWSVARRWSFPAVLPEQMTFAGWLRLAWVEPAGETLLIGLAATAISLVLALLWLEVADRSGARMRGGLLIVIIPLLLPQIAFLQGVAEGFVRLGLPAGRGAVIWAEVLFVFPYVMIALAGPWRAMDAQQIASAASLGAGPARRFWRVKLALMLRPLLTAAALGFAVACAQFLAVLLPGAGRVQTLATEAVALASGADRRLAALYGLVLAALPLLAYALALGVPAWVYRDRRGMRGER